MSFINKIKGPDERLVGVAYIHWIYGLQGILWLAGLMCFGLFVDHFFTNLAAGFKSNIGFAAVTSFSNLIFWICTGIGAILFFFYVLMIATTEIGLTDKRVIYKRGFLFVKVAEMDIEEIKAVNVNNGVFGRILNYGYVLLDARFVENTNLPALGDPYRFVKALNEMRTKLKSDSMQVVVEGAAGGKAEIAPDEAKQPEKKDKAETAHLHDERYHALNNNPLDAVNDLVQDTVEDVNQSAAAIEEQASSATAPASKREVNSQTGTPIKVPRRMFRKNPAAEADPLYKKPSRKLRPIIFRQEKMREDIKDSFAENTSPGAGTVQ